MQATPTNGARIRVATESDVDDIHALVLQLAIDTGMQHKVSSTPDDFRRHGFGERPSFCALIAELGGECVGLSLYFYEFSSWLGQLGVYVQDIVVRSDVRGTGLGKRLLATTVTMARDKGATHLRLSVDSSNDAAIRFYRGIGLTASADERIFHAHGDAFKKLAVEL